METATQTFQYHHVIATYPQCAKLSSKTSQQISAGLHFKCLGAHVQKKPVSAGKDGSAAVEIVLVHKYNRHSWDIPALTCTL
jgi:hypothetical protein